MNLTKTIGEALSFLFKNICRRKRIETGIFDTGFEEDVSESGSD